MSSRDEGGFIEMLPQLIGLCELCISPNPMLHQKLASYQVMIVKFHIVGEWRIITMTKKNTYPLDGFEYQKYYVGR